MSGRQMQGTSGQMPIIRPALRLMGAAALMLALAACAARWSAARRSPAGHGAPALSTRELSSRTVNCRPGRLPSRCRRYRGGCYRRRRRPPQRRRRRRPPVCPSGTSSVRRHVAEHRRCASCNGDRADARQSTWADRCRSSGRPPAHPQCPDNPRALALIGRVFTLYLGLIPFYPLCYAKIPCIMIDTSK